MYKLLITKEITNENYEEEYKKYSNSGRYGNMWEMPPVRSYPTKTLEVELTDEEFKKLKAETIKIFI